MKLVEQTRLYDPEADSPRGNCVAACIASIFEMDIEVVDTELQDGPSASDVAEWTNNNCPGLEYRSIDLVPFESWEQCDDEDGERWTHGWPDENKWLDYVPTLGYWMASVVSPRGLLAHGPLRGMPVTHAVVMKGSAVVWDPHPKRAMGTGVVYALNWWVAKDPALCLGY